MSVTKTNNNQSVVRVHYVINAFGEVGHLNVTGKPGQHFDVMDYIDKDDMRKCLGDNPSRYYLTNKTNTKKFTRMKQDVYLYFSMYNEEISMAVPRAVLESIDYFIHTGKTPFAPKGHGAVDIKHSSLIRLLLSTYNFSTLTAKSVDAKIWRTSKCNKYIALRTTNPRVLRTRSKVYRLICGMINLNIPIFAFKHDKDGRVSIPYQRTETYFNPIAKHNYY